MADKMRSVWRCAAAGSIDNVELVDEPLEALRPGEVRVRVTAVGCNFADVFAMQGLYSATPEGAFIPGLEIAGVVEALYSPSEPASKPIAANAAAGVGHDLAVGDSVMGVVRFGGYASYVNVEAQRLQRLPVGWEAKHGAAFPVQALTAFYGLVEIGGMRLPGTEGLAASLPQKSVLIHSMAGGVGLAALQVCLALGAPCVGTVGAAWKKDWLLDAYPQLAPEQIIVRTSPGAFERQLDSALRSKEVCRAAGVDIVFDAIAGPWTKPAMAKLAPMGRYVIFGAASFTPLGPTPSYLSLGLKYLTRPTIDPMELISSNHAVMGFNLIWLWSQLEYLSAVKDAMMEHVPWRAPKVTTYPFADMKAAIAKFQAGKTVGKVVLEPVHPEL
ncbi:zinc-binding dehydrogenase family Oxidoreductase [Thecamonas trahens ATCC 50062]|uniref:Zinc-binding dehydrogenase family Oxidoreductase n=1 Tax=Thecamonas trahens ATCC 50062 TaxID=461836 RepID=A0A0L0DP25_THETB|nr:zinc-binding dehydrogenase family Oxidoreductase [Thecamonas trahens ATCC 50062]KNC53163.1 zinc-binding dehydrogenase family Oxidoreductase [Thecamonas trahens ATCC 50062]|eukprot:XP_013754636.1 zinc-binding dehydrogenase family Oxidoreductase [Thecamonas trahens ATCC 50062]